jgi:putative cardiolipin synthase
MKNKQKIFIILLLFSWGISAQAENIAYLNKSDLAVAQRYLDIKGATSSIDLTTLEWDPCSTIAKVMTKKLREKTDRKPKVKVRLLVDSWFQWHKGSNKLLSQMQTYYGRQGFDFKFVNPPFGLTAVTGGNMRSHSKLLAIDCESAAKGKFISGGRNMTDAYFGMAKENLMDRDVAVNTGSAVTEACQGFNDLWNNDLMTATVPEASPADMQEFRRCVAYGPREKQLEEFLEANAAKIVARAKRFQCNDVLYTIDTMAHAIGTKGGLVGENEEHLRDKPTTGEIFRFLHGVKRSLTMENQYYFPEGVVEEILKEKRERGIPIRVYSNLFDGSKERLRGDHIKYMTRDNTGSQRNYTLSKIPGQIDRWEFTPKGAVYSIHSKTFAADGKDAIVSSYNIDPRSQDTNGESAVSVRNCPAFAKQVQETADLTASVWEMEEQLAVCQGRPRPVTNPPGKLDAFIPSPLK